LSMTIEEKIEQAVRVRSWKPTHDEVLEIQQLSQLHNIPVTIGCGSCFYNDLKRLNDKIKENENR